MKLNAAQLVGVPRCPQCGVAHPILMCLWKTQVIAGEDGRIGCAWGVYQCRTCGDVIMAQGGRGIDQADAKAVQLYPSLRAVDETVPAHARNYLQQAHETLHAPDAATVMAASAVDAMLKDKGYAEGSLYARIDKAVEDHFYEKYVRCYSKFMAHDESNSCAIGDRVRIIEHRPISKRKRWKVQATLDSAARV